MVNSLRKGWNAKILVHIDIDRTTYIMFFFLINCAQVIFFVCLHQNMFIYETGGWWKQNRKYGGLNMLAKTHQMCQLSVENLLMIRRCKFAIIVHSEAYTKRIQVNL